ncbi:uncharacterized protein G2W53_039704 [Senna tora]|uniref:Uncharacterized protein n=1 Tax=Senna tora TaxID=362788 RepID=A0A834W3T5_9FABA|nr:uncharacterized protein G2W53_039704 [Senna tora]
MRSRAPLQTFHTITSPIRALNPIRFSNTTRSDRIKSTRIPKYNAKRSFSLTCATTRLNLCFLGSYEIQSRFSCHNVFRDDLRYLPCDEVSQSRIKSARVPKYSAKRLNVFIQDLKHLSCEHEPHPSNKTARIPKYNAKRSIFNAIMSPIRALNPLGFPNTMRRRSV